MWFECVKTTTLFRLVLLWQFVKTSIGWKATRRKCRRRQRRSTSRASIWSKLLLHYNRRRSKSRFPNSNQKRILSWKSDSINVRTRVILFCFQFNIYGYISFLYKAQLPVALWSLIWVESFGFWTNFWVNVWCNVL